LIVDIRHKPTEDDRVMARWFLESGVPFLVAANKADKLKKGQIPDRMVEIRDTLSSGEVPIVPFSAQTGEGKDALLAAVAAQIKEELR